MLRIISWVVLLYFSAVGAVQVFLSLVRWLYGPDVLAGSWLMIPVKGEDAEEKLRLAWEELGNNRRLASVRIAAVDCGMDAELQAVCNYLQREREIALVRPEELPAIFSENQP